MAAHQCPNCGGYKTYSWWIRFLWQAGLVTVVAVWSGGAGLIFAPFLAWAWFKKPSGLRPHCCRICEYAWDVSAPQSTAASPRPGLLHLGNALLEREAAAAEEERQRRSRGG